VRRDAEKGPPPGGERFERGLGEGEGAWGGRRELGGDGGKPGDGQRALDMAATETTPITGGSEDGGFGKPTSERDIAPGRRPKIAGVDPAGEGEAGDFA